MCTGDLTPGVKRPGREADHSLLSSAEDENVWRYTAPPAIRLHGAELSQAQGQLYMFLSRVPVWLTADRFCFFF